MTGRLEQSAVRAIGRVTAVGIVVNITLAAVKVTIGIFARSQALVADGVHSVSDLVTDAAILLGAKRWNEPADKCHPYGHGRLETIISVCIGVAMCSVGLRIGWQALRTIGKAHATPPGLSAFAVAVLSVVTKEALFRWTAHWGKRTHSRAVVANAWHHRSDALSSVPVAAAVLGAHLFPNLQYLDHIAALLVTAMIVTASWSIAWPAFREIMEVRADSGLEERIVEHGRSLEGVADIHDVRSRRIGSAVLVDCHMLVPPDMSVEDAHNIAETLRMGLVQAEEAVADVLIHIEPSTQDDV